MKLEINNSIEKDGIKKFISNLKNENARKRAYVSLLALNSVVDFFKNNSLSINHDSICSNVSILEEFEIADIRVEGVRVDVRALMHDNPAQVWIPKKNFAYGLIPEIYVAVKVSGDISECRILGFIESKNVDKTSGNDKYYFVDINSLSPASSLAETIDSLTPDEKIFSEDEHERARELFLHYIEKNMSEDDKRFLLSHIASCAKCKVEFDRLLAFDSKFYGALKDDDEVKTVEDDADYTLKLFTGDIPTKEEVFISLDEPELDISKEELLESDEVYNYVSEDDEEMDEPEITFEEKAVLENIVTFTDTSEDIKEEEENAESGPAKSGLFSKIADKIRGSKDSEEVVVEIEEPVVFSETINSEAVSVEDLLAGLDEVEVVSDIKNFEKTDKPEVIFNIPEQKKTSFVKVAAVVGVIAVSGIAAIVTVVNQPKVSKVVPAPPAVVQPVSIAMKQPEQAENVVKNETLPVQNIPVPEPKKVEAPPVNTVKPVKRDLNNVLANAFVQGAGITISNISWEVGVSLANDSTFKNYLMVTGQALKMGLSKNLLVATDRAANDTIKIRLVLDLQGNIIDSSIKQSSGSRQVDDIVLQTLKETFNYTKLPKLDTKKDSIRANVIINL